MYKLNSLITKFALGILLACGLNADDKLNVKRSEVALPSSASSHKKFGPATHVPLEVLAGVASKGNPQQKNMNNDLMAWYFMQQRQNTNNVEDSYANPQIDTNIAILHPSDTNIAVLPFRSEISIYGDNFVPNHLFQARPVRESIYSNEPAVNALRNTIVADRASYNQTFSIYSNDVSSSLKPQINVRNVTDASIWGTASTAIGRDLLEEYLANNPGSIFYSGSNTPSNGSFRWTNTMDSPLVTPSIGRQKFLDSSKHPSEGTNYSK